jgi:NAD dependent epimerase/dehydratase family enzyme
MADEVLIAGQRVYPRALERAGYAFRYAQLADAFGAALSRRPQNAF